MASTPEQVLDKLDRLTQARLARLRSRPVDTTRLELRLNRHLVTQLNQAPPPYRAWWAPLSGVAAGLALTGLILLGILTLNNKPAVAATTELAAVHRALTDGSTATTPVNDVARAHRTLIEQWADAPSLPRIGQLQPVACCVHMVQQQRTACLLTRYENGLVTIMIARPDDLQWSENLPTRRHAGRTYHIGQDGAVRLVMFERDGLHLWIMATLPVETLFELAEQVRFDEPTSGSP